MFSTTGSTVSEWVKLLVVVFLVVLLGLAIDWSITSLFSERYGSDFPSHWTEQDYYLYIEINEVMQSQGYLNDAVLDKGSFERVFSTKDLSLFSVVQEGQAYSVLKKNDFWYVIETE